MGSAAAEAAEAAGVLAGGRTAIAFSGCKDFPIQDAHEPDDWMLPGEG
jgi:hypothetical protein